MITSCSTLSWFGTTAASNAATLRSQSVKPGAGNQSVPMSSKMELNIPNGNGNLMPFIQPQTGISQPEKPRQAGVGNQLNLMA